MPDTSNEPHNQPDNSEIISGDSENTPNKDDNSSTSKLITIFIICYILFITIGFIISILFRDFLLAFPICSLFVAMLYVYICTKNIRDCTNRIDHFVRYEHILCIFGIIQILAIFSSFPCYLFKPIDEVAGLGKIMNTFNACGVMLETTVYYIPLIPLNIITSIIHIATSIKVKAHLATVDIIPDENKKSIIKLRTISQISILLITIVPFVIFGLYVA